MPEIVYTKGDATLPIGDGRKVIAHVCNDEGKWGAGFVLAISKRWPEPEARYRQAFQGSPCPVLGDVEFVEVAPELFVANMVGQREVKRARTRPRRFVTTRCGSHSPRLRSSRRSIMPAYTCRGLAGGKWEEVEPIISDTLMQSGVPVVVYDFV